jgi:hypothetical protein
VTARVPREEREVGQFEFVDEMLDPSRVLMAAMQQDDRAAAYRLRGRPIAVEKRLPVVGDKARL